MCRKFQSQMSQHVQVSMLYLHTSWAEDFCCPHKLAKSHSLDTLFLWSVIGGHTQNTELETLEWRKSINQMDLVQHKQL